MEMEAINITKFFDEFAFLDTNTSVICILLCILWIYILIRKPSGLPPGPSWRMPILGHLREFTRSAGLRSVLDTYRDKYGEVYCLYLGRHLVVIVNGLDAIREAFVTRGEEFCHRPDTVVQKTRDKLYGIEKTRCTSWTTSRTVTLHTLAEFGYDTTSMEATIQDEISHLVEDIESYQNTSFQPNHILTTSVFNVNCSILLGTKYGHGEPEFQHALTLMRRCFSAGGASSLLNFLPFLRHLPGDFFRFEEFKTLVHKLNIFFEDRIEKCMNNLNADNGNDFITSFLKAAKANGRHSHSDKSITKDELKVIIGDVFAAGSETTAATLCRAISYLVAYPELQDRLYQEICSHVDGNRKPQLADRDHLVHTEAFIMETQRLSNLLMLHLPHTVHENVTFRGYTVPKGAIIFPDIQAVLSDPKLWGDPTVFRPGRFVSENGMLRKPKGFIPFFVGQRNIIGEQLSKVELFLVVSTLVQRFEFYSATDADSNIRNIKVGARNRKTV